MGFGRFAEVAGDTVAVIIDGRGPTPVIVAGTGVSNVVREAQGTYLMNVEGAQLSYSGSTPLVIEGSRYRVAAPAGAGGYLASEIVSATQLRIRTFSNTGLIDALFSVRIRRYP